MRSAPHSNRSRSTLTDVAEMAGVSATTVSLVLAGKAGKRRISEDTHARVHRAAATLGYTPNLLHRSMRRGRTHVISFYNAFRNREWSDQYMDRMSAGVEHAGGNLGYDVLVHCNFRRSTQETYEFLNGGFADGVILFNPPPEDPLLPLLRSSGLPTVLIDPPAGETSISSVADDGETGVRLIAEQLVAQGHRRIAAVVQPSGSTLDPTGRLLRLKNELAKLGVDLPDENAILWNRSVPEALDRLQALPNRPTALFVWHDRTAYRLLEGCEARGIDVPGQLSIVGYDGLVWPSTSRHEIASVHVGLHELANAAVKTLHRLIEGEDGPFRETISVSFHPGSTLAPPDSGALGQSHK